MPNRHHGPVALPDDGDTRASLRYADSGGTEEFYLVAGLPLSRNRLPRPTLKALFYCCALRLGPGAAMHPKSGACFSHICARRARRRKTGDILFRSLWP